MELKLFGDWYGVALTTQHAEALNNLREWVGAAAENVWYIGDTLGKLTPSGKE
jgi:hypothetical protein